MPKLDNMLAVLWLLRSRGQMTGAQLAEALETSVRTIYRYVDALCASGVPIVSESGPEGGFSLPDHFRAAPLFFEPQELVALFQAARFARETGYPYELPLEAALAKVHRNLTAEQAALVERHASALGVVHSPRVGESPHTAAVEAAAADGATLRLQYRKPDTPETEVRLVDPYAAAYRRGAWYLIGYCHLRQALREFRIDRIEALARTGQSFSRPSGFDVAEYLSEPWVQEQARSGPHTPVRLAGDPNTLARVCSHWYLRHCLVERTERQALFHVDPEGMKHLPAYFLAFGTSLQVLEPPPLREQVAQRAQAVYEFHAHP